MTRLIGAVRVMAQRGRPVQQNFTVYYYRKQKLTILREMLGTTSICEIVETLSQKELYFHLKTNGNRKT